MVAVVAVLVVLVIVLLGSTPSLVWSLVQGTGSASDGRVTVTVGDSWLAFKRMFSTAASTSPFLLVNVTFTNVGDENTTVGEAWYADAIWEGRPVSLSWYTFGGFEASGMLPVASTVAPGESVTGWLGFLLDASDVSGVIGALHLEKLIFLETTYGGQVTPEGSWSNVHQVLVRFEVVPA